MSQHKQSLRKTLISGLANRNLANAYVDGLVAAQEQFNAALDKLAAGSGATIDTDFVASLPSMSVLMADAPLRAQNQATPRKSMRSAMMNKRVGDALVDSLSAAQSALTDLMVKLDAQAGTLTDVDFESTLSVEPIDADGYLPGAQNKAPARKVMTAAIAHSKGADMVMDALVALADAVDAALAQLDTSDVTDIDLLKVAVIDPDAEIVTAGTIA